MWIVMRAHPTVSAQQLASFPFTNNFRPPQPLNGRVVLSGSFIIANPPAKDEAAWGYEAEDGKELHAWGYSVGLN